jgi:hypothetical protein
MTLGRLYSQSGQSTVEVVALLPLLVTLMFALLTFVAAGRAHEEAGEAAAAGARALLNDQDPSAAACAALGRSSGCRDSVVVRGRAISVTVRPRGPLARLNRSLSATETAKVGP